MTSSKTKLDSLTGLRFYLAMFVVFFHGIPQSHLGVGEAYLPAKSISFFLHSFNGGYAVSSFFILSGFVMWYSYSNREWTFTGFMGNRVARLFPIYLLGIAIVLLRWNNLLSQFEVGVPEALRRLALSLTMLQAWGTNWPASQMFNGPGWTLSVEMFFYVTFPLLFWIHGKSQKLFWTCCALITLLTPLVRIAGVDANLPICLRHWGYFTLGVLLCHAWKNNFIFNIGIWPTAILLFFGYQAARVIDGGIISMIFPVLIIGSLATADISEKKSSLFSNRWIILGGEISYAIYILHVPIQSIVYSLFYRSGIFLMKSDSLTMKATYLAICVFVTLVASYLAWRWIEVPARRYLVRRFSGNAV